MLVVGSAGFIGRELCTRLARDGHRVEGWSRQGTPGPPGMAARAVDVARAAELPGPPAGGWHAAYHLAAHSRPNAPWSRELVLENVALAARVFEHLARRSPGCRAVLASSCQVYAPSSEPHGEEDPLGPPNLYGLSKQLCEDYARYYAAELGVVIVRSFNVIGPGMSAGLLVPDLLERIRSGEDPLRMRGRDAHRDFLDVRDAVEAYVALLEAPLASGALLNLCSGHGTRVSELVDAIQGSLGLARRVEFADPGQDVLLGRPDRLRAATGWRPRRDLEATAASIAAALG